MFNACCAAEGAPATMYSCAMHAYICYWQQLHSCVCRQSLNSPVCCAGEGGQPNSECLWHITLCLLRAGFNRVVGPPHSLKAAPLARVLVCELGEQVYCAECAGSTAAAAVFTAKPSTTDRVAAQYLPTRHVHMLHLSDRIELNVGHPWQHQRSTPICAKQANQPALTGISKYVGQCVPVLHNSCIGSVVCC